MLPLARRSDVRIAAIIRVLSTSMNPSPSTDTIATASAPTHDEIAQCARALWTESGRPEGRDGAIWLEAEAERRLISA
jgi:hypothetical protein